MQTWSIEFSYVNLAFFILFSLNKLKLPVLLQLCLELNMDHLGQLELDIELEWDLEQALDLDPKKNIL